MASVCRSQTSVLCDCSKNASCWIGASTSANAVTASPDIRRIALQRSRLLCKLTSPYRLQGADELQSRWVLDEWSFMMQEEMVLRLETLQLCKVRASIRTLMLES